MDPRLCYAALTSHGDDAPNHVIPALLRHSHERGNPNRDLKEVMPANSKHEKDAQRAAHLAGGLPRGLLCPGGAQQLCEPPVTLVRQSTEIHRRLSASVPAPKKPRRVFAESVRRTRCR